MPIIANGQPSAASFAILSSKDRMLDSTPHQDRVAVFRDQPVERLARPALVKQLQESVRWDRRSQPAAFRNRRSFESGAASRHRSGFISDQFYGIGASVLDGSAIVLASIASGAGSKFFSPQSPVDLSVFAGGGILI